MVSVLPARPGIQGEREYDFKVNPRQKCLKKEFSNFFLLKYTCIGIYANPVLHNVVWLNLT